MKLRLAVALVVAQAWAVAPAQTKGQPHWVATWTTAQLLARAPAPAPTPGGGGRGGAARGPAPAANAPAAPAPAPTRGGPGIGNQGFNNQTVRMVVRTSIAGTRLRVKLTNAFGSTPVQVGSVHIGLRATDSGIVPGSDRALTFNGKPGCLLGPGVLLLSDPVDLNVPAVSDLAVSLYFPGETGPPTNHATGLHTTFIAAGDVTGQAALEGAATTQAYYYLAGVDVMASRKAASIVTYGDSITDGTRSTPNTNHSWPALLAARLAINKQTANLGVANMGISGNRVLRDGAGSSALARLDRDVLSQSGVAWLMMLEGINDIGREATVPAEAVTAEDLIGGYKQVIERAHAQGIQVIGCTITPYEGATYYRENGEVTRQAVNQWIRTGGAFDAVADFDAAVRDSTNPKRLRPEFDPGDHLHPNDAGYEAMANSIDLGIFTGKPAKAKKKK